MLSGVATFYNYIFIFMKNFLLTLFLLLNINAKSQNWQYLSSPGFSVNQVFNITMSISKSGIPYVGYFDPYANPPIAVKKFDGISWTDIGSNGITNVAGDLYFKLDNNDTPYLAFKDQNLGMASVMKFNGTNWNFVGSSAFSLGQIQNISIAFDRNNIPYVAYRDLSISTSERATVMFYNNGNWENVGSPRFSYNNIDDVKLAFDTNNTPIAVICGTNLSVKKFNGSMWTDLDTGFISSSGALFATIAIDDFNSPCIAYQDNSIQGVATVKKFDGVNWINVGTPNISIGAADNTSIIFQNNKLYLSYIDHSDSLKGVVKVFDGINWNNIGNPGFTPPYAYLLFPAVDTSGNLYAAFKDYYASNRISVMHNDISVGIGNANSPTLERDIVFPNPNNGTFYFQSGIMNSFDLINEYGIIIKHIEMKLSEKYNFTFSNIKPGIYFLKSKQSGIIPNKIIVFD
jgi:hypothetical protein